jgi:hypothetical protein
MLTVNDKYRIKIDQILEHPFFKMNDIPKHLPLNLIDEPPTQEWIDQYPMKKEYKKLQKAQSEILPTIQTTPTNLKAVADKTP